MQLSLRFNRLEFLDETKFLSIFYSVRNVRLISEKARGFHLYATMFTAL